MHAITATSALRQVLPRLAPDPQRTALRQHWHALAAIQCMIEPVALNRLVDTAVTSHDDHAIKLTAAALTEATHHDASRLQMAGWAFASAAALARRPA